MKLGLLANLTGPGSSSHVDDPKGAEAYLNYVNDHGGVNGQKIEMITADTTSTPQGALSSAQKLV